ncbi:Mediator of RNA polymerase II transcription subunit 20 [Halotydeus destructor]|nr:Mediator of RNA polymerase II transcription subunit 20 [Halotydeus destructor]
MGVVAVHVYPVPEGKSGQQAVDNLCKILETLGATKVGTFSVECETYHSSGININRTLNLFHNSEYPASCFSLLDNGTCLTSDINFDLILLNLSGLYQTKKSNKMESKGPKYQIGDFTIKLGSVSIGPSFRGILIEVEYGPCVVPAYCWDLMKEFIGSFMLPPRDPHQYLQGKMNEVFSPVDIVQQYNDHFSSLRRMPTAGMPPTSQPSQMQTGGRNTPVVQGPGSNQMPNMQTSK